MPHQNRIDPFSRLHAVSDHGLFLGNRGILHDENGQLTTDRWKTPAWIICSLNVPSGVTPHPVMAQGKYTHLFFMDEATALAAGHRPCAMCRHAAWQSYRRAITGHCGMPQSPMAADIKTGLFGEMREYVKKYDPVSRPVVEVRALPDGAMFAVENTAYMKWQGQAFRWSFSGYGKAKPLPERAERLTPALNCVALKNGYTPKFHASLPA